MKRITALVLFLATAVPLFSQHVQLTVEKIMRDPKWIGTSPSGAYWSADGKYLLFNWNPDQQVSDSLYYITPSQHTPQKATLAFRRQIIDAGDVRYNTTRTAYVYALDGDIYVADVKSNRHQRITQTVETESNPLFSFNDTRIVFTRNNNLYAWERSTGLTIQLTHFNTAGETTTPATADAGQGRFAGQRRGAASATTANRQEKWLQQQALENSLVLQTRKERRALRDSIRKLTEPETTVREIKTNGKTVSALSISYDGRFITYRLIQPASGGKSTIVPNYVTESGFTENIPARTKVGSPQNLQELYVYDRIKDTVWQIKTDSIPGIRDLPDYVKDYPAQREKLRQAPLRNVSFQTPNWSPGSNYAVLDLRAHDNKDRWLLLLDAERGKLSLLDRQRDEAWIAGPGIWSFGGTNTGWIDNNTFWFRSEATGYAHLYVVNVVTKDRKALTSGQYEVQEARLSNDKKYFYIITNEVHPGEKHYYRLRISDGAKEKLTTMTGANEVVLSPDEQWLAVLHSYSNKPWELYLQENKRNGRITQITTLAQSEEFKAYPWREPEIITIPARDGATIYGRLYKPAHPHPAKPAVIFVHGAGYLQNAHKWWSSYFREYMFHNLLADNGYTVLDIDYRGSAGYGRDWRTGIYRHMGGKDLTDHVDAAKYLSDSLGIDPQRIGIYGGSYGGFITLMAMFTTPGVFNAGAALRPVTDWAHYNHGYTSNILNEPFTDSIAYRRSSPIHFAEGLKGNLLICHGMVDVNVHFQDVVRLTQRLIELGKDNWELAVYPVEDHGFVEPSSWTDEYKRIFKLFETHLKR